MELKQQIKAVYDAGYDEFSWGQKEYGVERRVLCRKFFTSGTITHTPNNKPTRIIDYGDGTCDNKATVTINGKSYDILLSILHMRNK